MRQAGPRIPSKHWLTTHRAVQEALQASLESPEGRTLLADLASFVEKINPLLVEEHQML